MIFVSAHTLGNKKMLLISLVFQKLIWCIPSSWAGWAGPALTIWFSLYFCNKQMATISSALKKQKSGISSVLEKHIWGILSGWAGWAGPALTILFSLRCLHKKHGGASSVFKQMSDMSFVLEQQIW